MPILSMFYGIIVRMYYADNRQHHIPHIHVECGSDKAIFSIADGRLLAGPVLCRHGSKSAVKN